MVNKVVYSDKDDDEVVSCRRCENAFSRRRDGGEERANCRLARLSVCRCIHHSVSIEPAAAAGA